MEVLENLGVRQLVLLPFSAELASLTPLAFVAGKPRRTTALANISGVISGQSDQSISSQTLHYGRFK